MMGRPAGPARRTDPPPPEDTVTRKILATLLGLAVGLVLVLAIEMGSHHVYPPPEGMDFTDKAAVDAFVAQLPVAALALIVVAWVAGAFGGSFVAARVGRSRWPGWTVGILLVLATAWNLATYSHPAWMAIAGPALVVAGAVAGAALGAKKGTVPLFRKVWP